MLVVVVGNVVTVVEVVVVFGDTVVAAVVLETTVVAAVVLEPTVVAAVVLEPKVVAAFEVAFVPLAVAEAIDIVGTNVSYNILILQMEN